MQEFLQSQEGLDLSLPTNPYVVIANVIVELPSEAKWVFQDKRGLWYWRDKKPRVDGDDWNADKSPVCYVNEKGWTRPVKTPVLQPWQTTAVQATMPKLRPLKK